MTSRRLLTISGGTALLGAVLTGGLLTASASDDGASPGVTLAQDPGTDQSQDADRAGRQEAYLQRLAAKLGISLDALKAGLKSASLETVDERLAAGEITAEQAAALKERIEAGETLFGFGGPGHRHGPHGAGHGFTSEELMTFLGIDQATLDAARQAQKSLATIAQEAGKSRDQLKAFLTDQARESLAEAVTGGRLTQAQADEKLANFEAELDAKIDSVSPLGKRGPRGTAPSGTAPSGASFTY